MPIVGIVFSFSFFFFFFFFFSPHVAIALNLSFFFWRSFICQRLPVDRLTHSVFVFLRMYACVRAYACTVVYFTVFCVAVNNATCCTRVLWTANCIGFFDGALISCVRAHTLTHSLFVCAFLRNKNECVCVRVFVCVCVYRLISVWWKARCQTHHIENDRALQLIAVCEIQSMCFTVQQEMSMC